jgi:predicted ester cyclase
MTTDQQLQNWNTWQAAWTDLPAERRQTMIEHSIAPEVVYTDPNSVSRGYDEITVKMAEAQQNFPGCSFRQVKFRAHHDQAISEWTMLNGDNQPIFTGVSYAHFGSDDRLTSMIGFFEPVS